LGISTWIWFLVWVESILVIIGFFLILEIEWLLELLNTIVLLINFLWNKTGWSVWVDGGLSKSRWIWSSLGWSRFGWSSVFGVSFPSVGGLSYNSWTVESFYEIWLTGEVGFVSFFVVITGFSESSVWIGFNLSISTWIWLLVWVECIFVVVGFFLVGEVKWLLKLLNTIILLINFLWNKTGWSIWVNGGLSKSRWVWSSLRWSRFGWSSVFGISFPFVGGLSHNSCGVLGINEIWLSRKVGIVPGFIVSTSFSESSVWIGLSKSRWVWSFL
jgi:hypothetical protein